MRLLDDIRHIHQGADVHRAILQGEALQSFGQVQQISERTVDQRIHGSQHFAGGGDVASESRMVAEEVPLWAVQLRIEIIGGIDQLLGRCPTDSYRCRSQVPNWPGLSADVSTRCASVAILETDAA